MAVEDDHIPFVNAGVSAADIIDLDYGPPGDSYHHTIKDTVDKCSAASMTVVGRAVTAALEQLEQSRVRAGEEVAVPLADARAIEVL